MFLKEGLQQKSNSSDEPEASAKSEHINFSIECINPFSIKELKVFFFLNIIIFN